MLMVTQRSILLCRTLNLMYIQITWWDVSCNQWVDVCKWCYIK